MRRKVKRVIDGDTFELHTPVNGSRYVRIANVDAPEKHQFGGQRATNRLREMIGGRTVTVNPQGRSYGRVVAYVFANRRNVGNRLKNK